MKNGLYRALLLSSVFLVAFTIVVSDASAQQGEGVEVKPAIIQERVDPGGTYTYSVRARNVADTEKLFYITAADIKGADEDGRPIFAVEGETTAYDLSSWVTFSKKEVDLQPGQEVSISFTVKVPADASPGSHFGSILFSSDPPRLAKSGAAVGLKVGNIITLNISGEVVEEMRLREFSTEKLVYDAPPVSFNTKVENLGNTLLRPHGIIQVTDMFGKEVGSVEVNETAAAVFPGGDRIYKAVWEYEDFAFGRYQAILGVSYGDQVSKTVTGTTSFWVLPLKPIAVGLGSLLAIVLILYMTVKMYIGKKLREMGVDSKRSDADYYAKKYNKSASRLVFVALTVFIFGVAFLVMLFLMFA